MITRRQVIYGATAGAGISLLTGCQNNSSLDSSIEFLLAYENNPGEPIDQAAHAWAEMVKEESNGKLKFKLFPSSQLGSKTDLIDQMLAGAPIITIADGAYLADQGVPDFGILIAPYIFKNWEECWKLTESSWYQGISNNLYSRGLKLLSSNWIYGVRHTLTTKPINSLDDLQGMKIRVPNNIIQVEGYKALGATPTPMALGDVYMALQQGVIDGLENPLPVLWNGKFTEVAQELTLTEHVRGSASWLTGAVAFNKLDESLKEILITTAQRAGNENNKIQIDADRLTLQAMNEAGVKVSEVDKYDWREASKMFFRSSYVQRRWSSGLYENVMQELGY